MCSNSMEPINFWKIGPQRISTAFDGGQIVTDAGLVQLRAFEKELGILKDLAERIPDPRSPKLIHHSVEALLTQQVYQILAGYPDCNDADTLRQDPLFQILADVAPDPETPLASGSTLARFQYAYTRRDAEMPLEERPAAEEQERAQNQRIKILNEFLLDLFIRTRLTPLKEMTLDIDPTDDPTHGKQTMSAYHGYYRQHQYFPLLVFDGDTGFPLSVWLRPGTVSASEGAVDILRLIVTKFRAAWPEGIIRVRGDNGVAVPEVYEYCESEGLEYAFGYASNEVLKRKTAQALQDVELYHVFYGNREPLVQRFEEIRDYQAATWTCPRRIVAKIEVNPQGSQRRFVVTNMSEAAEAVYRDYYVQRGAVPEQPIGEMKNGLEADRLSASGFRANSFRLLLHAISYAIVVLYREAAAKIPEVATAHVSTLRQRLWKVGARVKVSARRICLYCSECWPGQRLWVRVQEALAAFVEQLRTKPSVLPTTSGSMLM